MTTYSQIEVSSNLLRDLNSKAIINTDQSKREAYLRSRQEQELKKREMEEMKRKIDSMENDISSIKNMLSTLIGKLSHE